MSYAEQAAKPGRQPIFVLEIDVDRCTRTYGVAPCTASGPAATKCFNTLGTCQDPTNYNKGVMTYRFASLRIDGLQEVGHPPTFPTLVDVSTTPTRLSIGESIGFRSSLSATMTPPVRCSPQDWPVSASSSR